MDLYLAKLSFQGLFGKIPNFLNLVWEAPTLEERECKSDR